MATGYYTCITISSVTTKYAPVSFIKLSFGAGNSKKTVQLAQNVFFFLNHKGNLFVQRRLQIQTCPPYKVYHLF